MTADENAALLAVLTSIRDRGAIGEASLPDAIAHAERFVGLLPDGTAVADLGSGGGLPGLVIAVRRSDLRLTLIERRASRADLLRRAVVRLDLGERVDVLDADVRNVARDGRVFDAVTARSFAAPLVFAQLAAPLCRADGLALVSEPPAGTVGNYSGDERWPAGELARLGWDDDGVAQGIRRLRRRG
ncbi:MAG: class I SAM-dependent methyltransferase [Ilumatobacteraceae bacterium]